jgi:hypothetical protein
MRVVGFRFAELALAASLLSACERSTGVRQPSGQLRLIAYNNQPLPAFVVPLSTVGLDGSVSHCNEVVSAGALEFDAGARYRVSLQNTNSCTGNGLGVLSDSGGVSQVGDSLSFSVPGNYTVLWGRISGSNITLYYPGLTLAFAP